MRTTAAALRRITMKFVGSAVQVLLAAVKVEAAECWLFVGRKRSCGGRSYA